MITPLRNWLLVELRDIAPPPGALIVVRADRPPSTHAVVLACGPEVRDIAPEARVVISRLQGIVISDDMLLLPESAVLATVPLAAPDANCITTADGGCEGVGCMHDAPEPS